MMDGVLSINKPAGMTSYGVVRMAVRALGIKKIGHAGTLDPFATGVLPICFGRGRKLVEYLMDQEKEYETVIRLGVTTDTEDLTGKVIDRRENLQLDRAEVDDVVAGFTGLIKQKAPIYSALKVNGTPMYKLARSGVPVERKERLINIKSIDVLSLIKDELKLRVVCSRGTYIRTLGADIAEKLRVGGHLIKLERKRSGKFTLARSISLDLLNHLDIAELEEKHLFSIDELLDFLPFIMVDEKARGRVFNGCGIENQEEILAIAPAFDISKDFRVIDSSSRLIAIGRLPACQSPDYINHHCSGSDLRNEIVRNFKLKKVFIRD